MSSVATMRPAAIVFREEQYFDWRVYALIAALEILTGLGILWTTQRWAAAAALAGKPWSSEFSLGVLLGLGLPILVTIFLLHMTTEVTPIEVRVWFGWLPIYRRVLPIDTVRRFAVVSYRPIHDYGGWGIRTGRDGERVLNARGNRGVRIELSDGTRLLIGSQRPEELASALDQAMHLDVV